MRLAEKLDWKGLKSSHQQSTEGGPLAWMLGKWPADSSSLYKINMLQNVTKGLRCGQVIWEVGWEDRSGVVWLRVATVMGCCEHSTEPAASVKCAEFLDWWRNC